MTIIITINEQDVINVNPAPKPRPRLIDKKRYTSSSGSFIGVLNLTIDSAPTSPRDNASDDLTTIIIKKVIKDIIGIIGATCCLPVSERAHIKYILLSINDAKMHIAKLIANSIGVGEEIFGILIVKLSIKIILLD